MATASAPSLATRGFRRTSRYDAWFIAPLLQFLGFGGAIAYSTWAAFQGTHYLHEPYLSPFYSPTVVLSFDFWPFNTSWLAWMFVPISPALIILVFPLGFRLTCYYYRKMYYRTFFMEPPACAVGEAGKTEVYSGETRFPFSLLNFHRYFLYAATAILFVLAYDFVLAFNHAGGTGVGLGTVILGINLATLTLFTLSCNSLRHIVGGKVDCFSCVRFGAQRHKAWKFISVLNKRHMLWAWVSLATVCAADFYVRLIAGGVGSWHFEDPVLLVPWYLLLGAGVPLLAGMIAVPLWWHKKHQVAAPAPAG